MAVDGDSIGSQEAEQQRALLKRAPFTDNSGFFCLLEDAVRSQSPVRSSVSDAFFCSSGQQQ